MQATAQFMRELEDTATVIVVVHDRDSACECCTHIVWLDGGKLAKVCELGGSGCEKASGFSDGKFSVLTGILGGAGGDPATESDQIQEA